MELKQDVPESEQLFQKIFDDGPLGMALVGLDYRLVKVNAALCRLLGYTEKELTALTFPEFTHPDDVDKDVRLAQRLFAGEIDSYHLTKRFLKKNQEVIWVIVSASAIHNQQGQLVYGLGMVEDITERKQREQLIRESENRLRTIIETEPECVKILDADGKLQLMNSAGLAMIEAESLEPLVGQSIFSLINPEHHESFRKLLQHVFEGNKGILEYGIVGLKGHSRWMETHMAPLRNDRGAVVEALGVTRDVTERKKADEALKRSQEWLGAIFEASRDGIVVEHNEIITFANQSYARIFGYERPAELLGSHISVVQSAENNEQMLEFGRRRLRGEPTPAVYEFKGRRKDGAIIDLEASVSTDKIAEDFYIITVVRDVAERKKMEDHLRQSQKIEAVGKLAGGVAHGFNNLLTAILGYCELLRSELSGKEAGLSYLSEIKKAGDRAAMLTSQLLAFSRKQVLTPQLLDLHKSVVDMQEILRRLIGESHKLVIGGTPSLGCVNADPGQITQVIMNLALNARDAMSDGGTLTIETSNKNLQPDEAKRMSLLPGPYIVLRVSDTGCGMDTTVQAHVFEPFFTTKDQGKGTGLGLATVYGIVKQTGGGISFHSELGVGTTFEIYLPQIEKRAESRPKNETKTRAPQGSETVLLVEDEEPIRKLVGRSLVRLGYRVLEAQDAAQALRISERHPDPIQLLLTDVRMPQMTGLELAQRLTALRPNLKVVYMSGHVERADGDQGLLSSTGAFLQKPFTPAALAQTIREVLDSPKRS